MFVDLKGYVTKHKYTSGCEVTDTKFVFYIEFSNVPNNCYWENLLSKFYDEYEKRNMSPIINTLLIIKYYKNNNYMNCIVMDFLKTKTDQQTIDKYMILL